MPLQVRAITRVENMCGSIHFDREWKGSFLVIKVISLYFEQEY